MTPPEDEQQDPLPEHDERVRHLLADARHDGGLPADVAARLDRVLAELAAGDVPGLRSPAELAARRRRRVKGMLAAAAAVAVVGIGLGQVVPGAGEDSPTAVTADSPGGSVSAADGSVGRLQSPSGQAAEDSPAAESGSDGTAAGEAEPEAATAPRSMVAESLEDLDADAAGHGLVLAAGRPVRLQAEQFAADAVRARERIDAGRRATTSHRRFPCERASWGAGTPVGVLYDGRPHVLVFREPAGDTQVVDLLQCGTGATLRSTTLPAG